MISYSQQDMQRQLASDRHLWKRLPGATAAILFPLGAILLGWDTGRWAGLATVVIAAVLSSTIPPRMSINIYVADVLDQLLKLPLWLCWLLLVWQLSAREQPYSVLGAPLAGAIIATALTWLLARFLVVVTEFAAGRVTSRGGADGA